MSIKHEMQMFCMTKPVKLMASVHKIDKNKRQK